MHIEPFLLSQLPNHPCCQHKGAATYQHLLIRVQERPCLVFIAFHDDQYRLAARCDVRGRKHAAQQPPATYDNAFNRGNDDGGLGIGWDARKRSIVSCELRSELGR